MWLFVRLSVSLYALSCPCIFLERIEIALNYLKINVGYLALKMFKTYVSCTGTHKASYMLKSVCVSASVCVSVCKSPQRLLNAGTQKVGKGTKKREKTHRGARDHFRRIRFIISREIN